MVPDLIRPKKVLFLCTGNSCRSQLAEALVNHFFSEDWIAYSAGTSPTGFVHGRVLEVLEELGIDHQGESKPISALDEIDFDLVVTVCDSAREECPVWHGSGAMIHRSFNDPALVSGTSNVIKQAFINTRDEILKNLPKMLSIESNNQG